MKFTINLCLIILFSACASHSIKKSDSWATRIADATIYRSDSLIRYNNFPAKWQYDIALLGQAIDKLGYIDTIYSNYNETYLNYFIQDDGQIWNYKLEDYNLDNVNPAKGLITLYKRTGKEKYLNAINLIITQLEQQPQTNSGGYWHKLRYPNQMWLDGIYMSSPFLAQYAYEFNKPEWFDTVAFQIILIYNKTLDLNTGLLYHAWDESKSQAWCDKETGQSQEFWGRSMGWYLMALTDVLEFFPTDHPKRDSIVSILNNTSEALLNVRDKQSGLWYQVLNKGEEEGNYIETSCSAMFAYAFAKGAKKGYLPPKFLDISKESFQGIIQNFILKSEDGYPVMTNICGAAGLGGDPYRDGSYKYYITEKRMDNDPKGIGPFILAAIELGL